MKQAHPPRELVGGIEPESLLGRLTALRSTVESLGIGQLGLRRWGNLQGDGTYLARFHTRDLARLLSIRRPAEMRLGAVLQYLDDMKWIGGLAIQRAREPGRLGGADISLYVARPSHRDMGLDVGLRWEREGERPFTRCYLRASFLNKISEYSREAAWETQVYNLADFDGPTLQLGEVTALPERTSSVLGVLAAVNTTVTRIANHPAVRGRVGSVS